MSTLPSGDVFVYFLFGTLQRRFNVTRGLLDRRDDVWFIDTSTWHFLEYHWLFMELIFLYALRLGSYGVKLFVAYWGYVIIFKIWDKTLYPLSLLLIGRHQAIHEPLVNYCHFRPLEKNRKRRSKCRLKYVGPLMILFGLQCVSTLRPRQNGRHFSDDIFKSFFFNENVNTDLNFTEVCSGSY